MIYIKKSIIKRIDYNDKKVWKKYPNHSIILTIINSERVL